MIQFIDFSTLDVTQFLVMDEDAYYKWTPEDTLKPVQEWMKKRDEYKFKLKYNDTYTVVSITVYYEGECILCEQLEDIEYL